MIVLYVFIAILVLLVMITIHEAGHYTAGRLLGFGIEEFSIGFGPRLFQKKKKNGELFSVRLLPLGGYCAFTGEGAAEDQASGGSETSVAPKENALSGQECVRQSENLRKDGAPEKRRVPFEAQKPWKRLIVLLAGAGFNFFSAFLFSFIYILVVGYAVPVVAEVYADPATGEPYTELMSGDTIVAVNGREIGVVYPFTELIADADSEEPTILTIVRDGQPLELSVRKQTVLIPDGDGYVEKELFGFSQNYEHRSRGFFGSIADSFPYTFKLCGAIFQSLGMMLTGQVALTDMTGPVGTVAAMATYAQINWQYMLFFLPLLACNLAIFNILPFPSLDGARSVFVIIEWIRRKPVNKRVENAVHTVGLMALLAFVVVVDVIGFIARSL